MRRALLLCLTVAGLVASATVAHAAWIGGGAGVAAAIADAAPAGETPAAVVSGRNVTVTWPASAFSTGAPVAGYRVRRYDQTGAPGTVSGACSGPVTALTCTEPAVSAGAWTYAVVPEHEQWRGPESGRSAAITVAPPSLALTSSGVTSLPSTVTGSIASFVTGSAVAFRLDDPDTGVPLSGSISPDPVGAGGTADVTVTLPLGTAAGDHTVYAVGSSGDVAGAPVTVTLSHTLTTAPYDVRDASSGSAMNVSDALAFAADGRAHTTSPSPTTFSAARYRELDLNGPLPESVTVAAASLNLRLSGNGATACFYFEVRRASTNAVLGTHGSPASPVACSTSSGTSVTSTPLPSVTTGAIANDLRIRIFDTNAAGNANTIDLAVVSADAGAGSVTLHGRRLTETLGAATATPWSLAVAGDGAVLASQDAWARTFSGTRYLQLAFPAYVPSGATNVTATLELSYRNPAAGVVTCHYLDVHTGTTKIAGHGTDGAPLSCNATGAFVTDVVALPEINTPARANGLWIRMYVRADSGSRARRFTEHDLASLRITYTP